MKHFKPEEGMDPRFSDFMPTDNLKKVFPKVLKKTKMSNICVGPGWTKIVFFLLDGMENLRVRDNEVKFWVHQIKEKFGVLRVYVNFDRKYGITERIAVDTLILAAENLSLHTCEISGIEGRLYERHGWLKTLCDEVATKHGWQYSVNADQWQGQSTTRSVDR